MVTHKDNDHIAVAETLSCKLCRKRKIRCDKRSPCNNCQKSNLECVFPQGRRRPTQKRPSPDTGLVERLRELEHVVQALKSSVQNPHREEDTESPLSQKSFTTPEKDTTQDSDTLQVDVDSLAEDLSRLDTKNGRSRYVNNALWASLSQEIADMQELLDEQAPEDDDSSQPFFSALNTPWAGSAGMLFRHSPLERSISTLHPTKDQMLQLWSIYEQNVDSVVKIFHLPATEKLFKSTAIGTEPVSTTNEPALFSIYYAAIVSLNEEKCQSLFQESRSRLLGKYRWALEQALARADFLNTSSLIVLQAFALFAICVRRYDDTRLIVTWSAIAVRIAMALGLHRDGSHFGLNPFETEVRRRVWWHLVLLDSDSSRDHGMDAIISDMLFDTKMPLNIEDSDIYPGMSEPPAERADFTTMTNPITRFEISLMAQRLASAWPQLNQARYGESLNTLARKEVAVRKLQNRLDEKYLQHCDFNKPLQRATAITARSACAMLWMIMYHPEQRKSAQISQDVKDQLFSSMVEVIENTRLLECNGETARWGWYFHNDVQWPAIAYVLNELLVTPPGPSMSRAWKVMHAARRQWDADSSPLQKGMLWRAVRKMSEKNGLFNGDQLPQPSSSTSDQSLSSQVGNLFSNVESDRIPTSMGTGQAGPGDLSASKEQASSEGPLVVSQLDEDMWLHLEDYALPSGCDAVPKEAYSFLESYSMPELDAQKTMALGEAGGTRELSPWSSFGPLFGNGQWPPP